LCTACAAGTPLAPFGQKGPSPKRQVLLLSPLGLALETRIGWGFIKGWPRKILGQFLVPPVGVNLGAGHFWPFHCERGRFKGHTELAQFEILSPEGLALSHREPFFGIGPGFGKTGPLGSNWGTQRGFPRGLPIWGHILQAQALFPLEFFPGIFNSEERGRP